MKKLLVAVFTIMVASSCYAQGTVNFNNRVLAFGVDAPVSVGGPEGPGPGPAYSAALYYQGQLVPGSVTTFRDGSSDPRLAHYIHGLTVTIPGTTPGQQNVVVEMRAWLTSFGSFEAAGFFSGTSGDLVIPLLGGSLEPTANNNFPASFTGMLVEGPEPSPVTLGLLGAIAMFLLRRQNGNEAVRQTW
jgi:hypothetical protein